MKKTILITDLDNTLFDWVDLWVRCFSAMLDQLVKISGIPEDDLKREIAVVHKRHGTSEYAFLVEEVPSLRKYAAGNDPVVVFADAINAYRTTRREHLRLFPSVAETLLAIKGRGTRIVGYTESMAFYSNYRIRRLGLDGVIDDLYCPADHQIPENMSPEAVRRYPSSQYTLRYTASRLTPAGSRKPDTDVLNSIISNVDVPKEHCVYVGDSLMKDVAMAIDCGVDHALAEYGVAHQRPEYKLLQEVTHWSRDDVEREQRLKARVDIHPQFTLDKSFGEILSLFDFADYSPSDGRTKRND